MIIIVSNVAIGFALGYYFGKERKIKLEKQKNKDYNYSDVVGEHKK